MSAAGKGVTSCQPLHRKPGGFEKGMLTKCVLGIF